ncbi:MAG: winged helix-turn-helix transcriptional regulator [Pseudorhodobacter sp.]|nr:winged helix-turn-helix transcriptional regulator [Pseudorhodobacter sp.]
MDDTAALLHLLADPSRLTIVESLRSGECTVGQIVARVGIQQSGVSRHLRILHQAGVVQMRADGQRRLYALRPEPFAQLETWAASYRALWSDRLDRFAGALTAVQLERDHDAT